MLFKRYINVNNIRDIEVHDKSLHTIYTTKLTECIKNKQNDVTFKQTKVTLEDIGALSYYAIIDNAVYLRPYILICQGNIEDAKSICLYFDSVETAAQYADWIKQEINNNPNMRILELRKLKNNDEE